MHARTIEIADGAVRFTVAREGGSPEQQEVAADSVIVATTLRENPDLADALRAAGRRVVVVGDAGGVGYIEGAIHDGFLSAIRL